MSRIKNRDTKAELLLRKFLFARGIRYRVNVSHIMGKPDIVIERLKIAIFVDGDWWHGRNYMKESHKYSDFWKEKISRNMARDKNVNCHFTAIGWKVIRIWQKDLEKNPVKFTDIVLKEIGS